MKSTLQKVTWSNTDGEYVIKTTDVADANGSRPVYKRDSETGAPVLTTERAIADQQGGWKVVNDTDAAKPANAPAPPPPAKFNHAQWEDIKANGVSADGTFPDGKGNNLVDILGEPHPAIFDRQLLGWKKVDPDKPNDFSKSVPIKLDGKGGAEVLTRVNMKGGKPPVFVKQMTEDAVAHHKKAVENAKRAYDDAYEKHKNSEAAVKTAENKVENVSRVIADTENALAYKRALPWYPGMPTDPQSRAKMTNAIEKTADNLSSLQQHRQVAEKELNNAQDSARITKKDKDEKATALQQAKTKLSDAENRLSKLES
ncbi:hypothetical protein [Dyella sp.]|uniref:hypothetical protein n=1 Tax=Dyella sp. TaxID=1869338 RepID=UPI002FD886D1